MAKPRPEPMILDAKFHVFSRAPGTPLRMSISHSIAPFCWGMMGTSDSTCLAQVCHTSPNPNGPWRLPATPTHPHPPTPIPSNPLF